MNPQACKTAGFPNLFVFSSKHKKNHAEAVTHMVLKAFVFFSQFKKTKQNKTQN